MDPKTKNKTTQHEVQQETKSVLPAVKLGKKVEKLTRSDAIYEEFKIPGTIQVGVIGLKQVGRGKHKSITYEMETYDGNIFFFAKTVLADALSHCKVGDIVYIKYKGMVDNTEKGTKWSDYDVYRIDAPEGYDADKHIPAWDSGNEAVVFMERD